MLRTAIVLSASMFVGSAFACEKKTACNMTDASYKTAAMTGELPSDATKANFTVTGMDCGACAKTIRAEIEKLEGVHIALVDADSGKVDVAFDKAKISADKIAETVNALNEGKYKATANQS